jgi:hypothetical protein
VLPQDISPDEIGRPWFFDGHTGTVDEDLLDGVNAMLAYLRDIADGADWAKVEFRVDLADYFPAAPPVPVFGTVDAAVFSWFTETLEIVDYKHGSGVLVSPKNNPQLLFYAAGAIAQLPQSQKDWPRTIKLTIVQPRAAGVAAIRSWETSLVDVLMWVDDVLVPGVEACAKPDAPFNPGAWCRFCPVAHACPRLQEDAVAMAKREFDDIPDDPAEIADALNTAERAQLWIDRVREFALDQLQHQVRIPGWGLVPTRPARKWLDTDVEIARTLENAGAEFTEVWEHRVRSPAQMEKTLHKTSKGRRIWDRVAIPLIEARSTGVKLGRAGPDAVEEFDDEV